MRSLLWTLTAVAVLAGLSGCCCTETQPCGAQDCGYPAEQDYGYPAQQGYGYPGQMAPSGPPSAAITYPYYTTRGPRDFLAANPTGIGP